MTLESDRLKSLKREHPENIPVRVSVLPSAWIEYRETLDDVLRRYPAIYKAQGKTEQRDYDEVTQPKYLEGETTDAWGCVWQNVKRGMAAIVTRHPAPRRADVHALPIPNEDDGMPHGFMFLRLADIRGFEELMVDFAEDAPELQILIDKVLAYNLRQVKLRIEKQEQPEQIVYFGDDLGMQQSLPISPDKWRKYLKPCYAQIYRLVHEAGHYVYMHTDGHILEIIPDLIDCGVDVVNPQVGANGLDGLAHVRGDKLCIDLDLNRQMFPFWRPSDIDAHVKEAVDALGSPEGGLWLTAEAADDVPLENIDALCAALETHSNRFSHR